MKLSHKIYAILACTLLIGWPVWEFGKFFFDWQYRTPKEYFRVRSEVHAHMKELHPDEDYLIAQMKYYNHMDGYRVTIRMVDDPDIIKEMEFFRRGYGFHCWEQDHWREYPFVGEGGLS